ncbi:hypothetical protein [Hyphomicrobium sp.]|uniref:hypothetical protein n=1 Tax=Hyphomicrobium sp. TaxID=82 RepID=UPI002D777D7B|nr:hypothetical protein [Hyphomicrobium sp.]HET6389767.1 hypothetical protein [Hyphomicrobium sp.]
MVETFDRLGSIVTSRRLDADGSTLLVSVGEGDKEGDRIEGTSELPRTVMALFGSVGVNGDAFGVGVSGLLVAPEPVMADGDTGGVRTCGADGWLNSVDVCWAIAAQGTPKRKAAVRAAEILCMVFAPACPSS